MRSDFSLKNTILHHAHRELYTILFSTCFTLSYVLDLDYDSRMSPILLVVEITYDLGLRVETGTERPLLLYTIYKCTVQYSTQLI